MIYIDDSVNGEDRPSVFAELWGVIACEGLVVCYLVITVIAAWL